MPDVPTACPSELAIRELASKGSGSAELSRIGAHVAGCESCRKVLTRVTPTSLDVNAPTQAAPLSARDARAREDDDVFELASVDEGRYELRREIARGGMGRIVEAWDRRHQRKVAIKLLLKQGFEARRRFVREAKITAQLQHPAIVPLYEAGEWLSGEPFFAMKLVEGRAFSDVIDDAKTLREKLALLPNLIAMTEALAYAHDHRVIHRDIKPSNVLIGAFGETVVIDWGIAKHRVEPGAAGEAVGAPVDDNPFETKAGSAMGTVGYMSPEQAHTALVDERADVYSLGAVLYHLFAGIQPHPSTSLKESLEMLISGPPEPLSKLAPELAPDIVAIVEKAMARDPDARYQDAREMAEDLKRFQAGKLVAAHSYSLGTLLRRWVVKHRAVVTTAAVLLVALLATVAVSVRRVVRERDRASEARAETEKARAIAVSQRDAAEKLVEFVVNDLKVKLEAIGKLDLITGIGEEVDRYYEAASPLTFDAPTLVRRAKALQLIAIVQDHKLDENGAMPLFEHAIALCERALELSPNDAPAQIMLVNIEVSTAGALLDLGKLDAAEKHARHGVEVGREAVAKHPGDTNAAGVLARGELRLALALRDAGRKAEAPPLYVEACSVLETAFLADPANLPLHRQLGWAYFERGDAAIERGDLDDAGKSLARSAEVRAALYARDPSPDRATDLAWAQLELADVRLRKGEFDAAITEGTAAVTQLEKMAATDPGSALVQRDLADALLSLVGEEIDVDRCPSAAARATRAVAILEALAAATPSARSTALVLNALSSLGDAELCAARPKEARAALERASSTYAKSPDRSYEESVNLMDGIGPLLALAQLADGAPDVALATARAAVTRAEGRVTAAPDEYQTLQAMGLASMALGEVLAARHDPGAAAAYRAAHDAFTKRMHFLRDPLLDPVTTAEAAIKLARLAPKDEASKLDDEAIATLEGQDRAHRLVPRGARALADARALTRRPASSGPR